MIGNLFSFFDFCEWFLIHFGSGSLACNFMQAKIGKNLIRELATHFGLAALLERDVTRSTKSRARAPLVEWSCDKCTVWHNCSNSKVRIFDINIRSYRRARRWWNSGTVPCPPRLPEERAETGRDSRSPTNWLPASTVRRSFPAPIASPRSLRFSSGRVGSEIRAMRVRMTESAIGKTGTSCFSAERTDAGARRCAIIRKNITLKIRSTAISIVENRFLRGRPTSPRKSEKYTRDADSLYKVFYFQLIVLQWQIPRPVWNGIFIGKNVQIVSNQK